MKGLLECAVAIFSTGSAVCWDVDQLKWRVEARAARLWKKIIITIILVNIEITINQTIIFEF